MAAQIHLAFVDDWEVRGDGSGDPRQLQFRPIRQLTRLFEERSIRGSFNAEVMQQITFRLFQDKYPHLKEWADEWEEVVIDVFGRGHDFQLHLHPQWKRASYDGRCWSLTAPWSILEHSREDAARMIEDGIELLQGLLRPIRAEYRCVSFRAGSWCIAPSMFILDLLASHNIQFDMSIVKGISYKTPVQLDYRGVQEGFFPFYPDMQDARRVSPNKEPIVCIPTNSFPEGPRVLLRRDASKIARKIFGARKPPGTAKPTSSNSSGLPYREWVEHVSLPLRVLRRLRSYLTGRWSISDIAQLEYSQLSNMLEYIRRRADRSRFPEVSVILENHTKDITNFSHIERFLDDIAVSSDIRCITLTELGNMLQAGRFPIRRVS